VFAGLRIGEALDLRWRDVDLAGGRLRVRGTKTDAADRTVELLPVLRDELIAYAATRGDRRPEERVFASSRGGRISESNVRNRALTPAANDASKRLTKAGAEPLPDGLTPHSLRRTFTSLLVALGRDPAVVMRQMGHTTPHMTLGMYAAAMDWADGERERLRALVEGAEWQETGNTAPVPVREAGERVAA
jgi:integrase